MPKITRGPESPAETETPAHPERSMLEWALYWAEQGWPVFPLRPNDKIPLFPSPHKNEKSKPGQPKCTGQCGLVGHGVHDGTRDPEKIAKWWGQNPNAGIGGSALDRLIFDFDYEKGAERKPVFPLTREHLSGRENGNCHVVYRPGGEAARAIVPQTSRSFGLGPGVDVRAGSGSYVVLPPSNHPDTLRPYTIANQEPEHLLTDEEVETIFAAYGAKEPAAVKGARKGLSVVSGESREPWTPGKAQKLSELLGNPPERGAGQTNDWLTAVAGHYAKMHRDKRDLYEVEVRRAAAMVDPDYEDTEKVLESVWGTESMRPARARLEGGFLAGTGLQLLVQASVGSGDDRHYDMVPWANFDLRADGVMIDDDNHRSYQVTMTCLGRVSETTLLPEVVADPRKLKAWLSRFGGVIIGHEDAHPRMTDSTRLQLYLESQRPAEARVVPFLGWDPESEQYVTLEGAITATARKTIREAGVIANRDKVNHQSAKYHYGFAGTWEEAQAVLREVQGFHFDDVVHLFGAWWAAALLKPQAMRYTSLFPFYAAEAGSGSAKTNGYFALMVALNGNYQGTVVATKASFRDSASVHANGILWADDMDDPQNLQEIVRAATSGGTMRKKGEDRENTDATLITPLLFTGEALMLSNQKALLERGVLTHPQSPTERTSLKPDRQGLSQWKDITDLKERYPGVRGLSELAGWYVQEALKVQSEFLAALQARLAVTPGRRGEKYAVLTAGARLMDHLLGEEDAWAGAGQTARWVDAWAEREQKGTEGVEHDSRLTIKLIPWAIETWGIVNVRSKEITPVDFRSSRNQAPPVLVFEPDPESMEEPEVWVNTRQLAQAWHEAEGGRVDLRLESPEGISMQLAQVAYPAREAQKNLRIAGQQKNYRKLLPGYAELILARVKG
ncbi:DNA primase/polymerase [Microbacterium phage Johann]|uniref:DNA primase/polymerase n=2 Tax=Goodmanvirus goodman TaxID=2734238 RepID=A0A3G3M0Q7_9CAUD|nr:DNA polymerase/primase [Microbacterium phage Goodman]AYQ99505.1 DNA primase/polymerase [Microbacterium phage Goodman]AYQ99673.1 DNA primase/polymerase [Microbacterium phage Johann]